MKLCVLLFSLLCLVCGGCIGLGYHAGAKSLFGENIQTIYVPIFEADPTRRHVAERLTESVCKRIEERSPYKVVSRPSADSVLLGRIVMKSQNTTLVDDSNDPRQKVGTLSVQVKWTNRREQELRSETLSWKEGTATATASDHYAAEFGQSLLTSEQNQIDDLAERIVNMMEMPW
ncbi:hypothetical protein FACS189419_00460 [Planctomycetales bacterium]|nr:hypothetical protein FACS189419_00460 [Planctomycetales bacterium]